MNASPVAARRARLFRLQAAVAFCDRLGAAIRSRRASRGSIPVPAIGPGLSVIIPERGNPTLLRACLESLESAAREVAEPLEVIVVVSGSEGVDYRDAVRGFPGASWIFHPAPMSFSEAVRRGVGAVRYPWVYLLNSDVSWKARSLAEIASVAGPARLFACIPDPSAGSEPQTGGDRVDCVALPGWASEILDTTPEDETTVRGGVYAGGGASLFQAALLRRSLALERGLRPVLLGGRRVGSRRLEAGI